ncbi:MAG: hypothetical protein KC800_05190 [Candidatus Eremiobacteraeota bacterium]|nr:hypothetical protein [Candidatus Eremiobacteraeota bacterium]
MEKNKNFVVILAIFILTAFMTTIRVQARQHQEEHLTSCKTNLKRIGTALEMYSTDWSGRYPTDLEALVPAYIDELPVCPAADSFSYQLELGTESPHNESGMQDYYYLCCQGENHFDVGVPGDFPAIDSISCGGPEQWHGSLSGR